MSLDNLKTRARLQSEIQTLTTNVTAGPLHGTCLIDLTAQPCRVASTNSGSRDFPVPRNVTAVRITRPAIPEQHLSAQKTTHI